MEARASILSQAANHLISLGEDPEAIRNFPIDDNKLIRGHIDLGGQAQDTPAGQREFEALIAQMSPEDQEKARLVSGGTCFRVRLAPDLYQWD